MTFGQHQEIEMKKRPLMAVCFSTCGILTVAAVWYVTSLANGLSALGSGASTKGTISVPLVVALIAVYFASGAVASLCVSRPARLIHAAVAHISPIGVLYGFGSDWAFGAALVLIIFAVFAFAWYRVLALPRPRDAAK